MGVCAICIRVPMVLGTGLPSSGRRRCRRRPACVCVGGGVNAHFCMQVGVKTCRCAYACVWVCLCYI